MMPITPAQCTANDLRMRETLAKAERHHQLTRSDAPVQRRSPVVMRIVRALQRPTQVLRPKPAF